MAKKKSTTAINKRKLDEIIAELPTKEELSRRLQPLTPTSEPPRLQLPSSLNLESPYAIFSLFISEEIFEFISQSTNEYAQRNLVEEDSTTGRAWKDTTTAEIKVFFGILIYMGVHPAPRIDLYWGQDRREGPLHSPPLYMTLKRFEQIKRYLHISRPDEEQKDTKQWWYKLEPLASLFDKAAQKYYQPGSNISIDETMIRCFGRTKHTVKIPNKPIEQGYKTFVLAEHGYNWTFTWSSRLWGIMDLFKYPGLSPTASIVLDMIKKLPGLTNSHANSPFNSPSNSSANSSANSSVNSSANSHALAPYIVYMDNYFTSVAPFGDEIIKKLEIPTAINNYNHYMGGVDIANQYRASYEIHRKSERNWFPLFYFFLDAAIVNAYRIQYLYKQQQGASELPSQLRFRQKLYQELFAFASQVSPPRPTPIPVPGINHQRIQLNKRKACVWCQYKRQKGQRGQQANRSRSGCLECGNVALCVKGQCWDEFHRK